MIVTDSEPTGYNCRKNTRKLGVRSSGTENSPVLCKYISETIYSKGSCAEIIKQCLLFSIPSGVCSLGPFANLICRRSGAFFLWA